MGGRELHSTHKAFNPDWVCFLARGYAQIISIFPGVHVIFDQIKISGLINCSSLGYETGVILLIVKQESLFIIFPPVFCFRLPDGFTQLRTLAHLALNDVSLQTLPNDIGKYVYITKVYDIISFVRSPPPNFERLLNKNVILIHNEDDCSHGIW